MPQSSEAKGNTVMDAGGHVTRLKSVCKSGSVKATSNTLRGLCVNVRCNGHRIMSHIAFNNN